MTNTNNVNGKLEQILEILRKQNEVLDEHSKELKYIKERSADLEKGQKSLAADQDVMRAYYHEINARIGRLDTLLLDTVSCSCKNTTEE